MAKGQTFSITLPIPIVEKLDKCAKMYGTSRSGAARIIIMNHFEHPATKEEHNASTAHDLQTKNS